MFTEVFNRIAREKQMSEIDERLVDALFYPAIKAEFFNLNSLGWKDSESRYKGWEFIKDLEVLSEFYAKTNPVLSAALWGIWNSVNFQAHPSLLGAFFPWQPKQKRLFFGAKALVATAAIQFADGGANTISTSYALSNQESYDRYLKSVESAIQRLQKIAEEVD